MRNQVKRTFFYVKFLISSTIIFERAYSEIYITKYKVGELILRDKMIDRFGGLKVRSRMIKNYTSSLRPLLRSTGPARQHRRQRVVGLQTKEQALGPNRRTGKRQSWWLKRWSTVYVDDRTPGLINRNSQAGGFRAIVDSAGRQTSGRSLY